ncbi:MAG: toll/interleukin-1 receptor domain-containing protein [Verrucomicrobiales bacterium]|nr:toll/interleukin-1 receptor domain-containing protein [Verrucomicrobiales bacterium]
MSKKGKTPKLFLSYRRSDLNGHASAMVGRIHDRLQSHFGRDNVFMDVDSIPPGVDFVEHLNHAVSKADVLLAVVGPNWVELLKARAADSDDFVKIEVKAALDRSIPVIPLLVGAAQMPSKQDLPEELGSFVFRNAVVVDSGRDFNSHMRRLIDDIEKLVSPTSGTPQSEAISTEKKKKKKPVKWVGCAGFAIVLLLVSLFLISNGSLSGFGINQNKHSQATVSDRTYSLAGLKFKLDVISTFDGEYVSGTISAQEHGQPGKGYGFSGTRNGDFLSVKIANNDEWWHGLELANPQADGSYSWELEDNDTLLKLYVSTRNGTYEWELPEK